MEDVSPPNEATAPQRCEPPGDALGFSLELPPMERHMSRTADFELRIAVDTSPSTAPTFSPASFAGDLTPPCAATMQRIALPRSATPQRIVHLTGTSGFRAAAAEPLGAAMWSQPAPPSEDRPPPCAATALQGYKPERDDAGPLPELTLPSAAPT